MGIAITWGAIAFSGGCRRQEAQGLRPAPWIVGLKAEGDQTASAKVAGVAIDTAGRAIVAGTFRGGLRLGHRSVASEKRLDGFAAKLGPDGAVEWLVRAQPGCALP